MDYRFFSMLSHLTLTQHTLSARFNTLAWVKVDLDVQNCCVSFEPEVRETHSGVKNRKMCLSPLIRPSRGNECSDSTAHPQGQ